MYAIIVLTLMIFTSPVLAEDLVAPRGYSLLRDENGFYSMQNKDGETVIPAQIIKIGWNKKWIAACVENESIDTDLKRYFYINRRLGGASDTINQENWNYFKEVYPGLLDIEYQQLSEQECP